jgi:hypothetical protein
MFTKQSLFGDRKLYCSLLPLDLQNELLDYSGNGIKITIDDIGNNQFYLTLRTYYMSLKLGEIDRFLTFINGLDERDISDDVLYFLSCLPPIQTSVCGFGWMGYYYPPLEERVSRCLMLVKKDGTNSQLHINYIYRMSGFDDVATEDVVKLDYIDCVVLQHKLELLNKEVTRYDEFMKTIRHNF